MSHPCRFRLSSRGLLLAAISAAFAQPSLANSGRVDFTAGNVTVTGTDGSSRRLAKGNEVKTGDHIISDANGRAQIRFSDGSFVSLQPNTDFDIKNYAFSGQTDGSERAFFGLIKGAMRTVTGLVGRVNRNAYLVTTPTATVGIRGTGGVIAVGSDGSTLVLGTSGVWTLSNAGGSIDVPAGRAASAGPNPSQPPQQTSQGPSVPAPQSGGTQQQQQEQEQEQQQQQTFSQGESRSSTGTQTDLAAAAFKPLVTGSGYAIAYVGAEGGTLRLGVPRDASFNSTGMMTSFVGNSPTYTLGGTHAEFATADGVLAWGRWIGQVNATNACCSSGNFNANQGLHYVVGMPTPAASFTGNYSYNMIGATSTTVLDGSVAPGTLTSATLKGYFSSSLVSAAFAGNIGGLTFSATVNNMELATSTARFSGNGGYSGTLAGCCSSASVQGFFAGSGASHAGFVYSLSGTNLGEGSDVIGAAALSKGVAVPSILASGPGYAIAYAGAEGGGNFLAVPRNATFNGTGMMTSFVGDLPTYTLAGTQAESATADGVLAWGRWIGNVNANTCCTTTNFTANQGLHHVVGTPTPAASLPTGVTYTYNMIGATSPTVVSGSVAPGTLTSATLTGNFSSNLVSAAFAGSIGGLGFSASVNNMLLNTGTASFSANNGIWSGSASSGCSNSVSVNGFFAGSGASHAGISYQLNNAFALGGTSINGAAAFRKGGAI